MTATRNKQHQKFCEFIKPYLDQLLELQISASDFEQLKVIGRGAFGSVSLVRSRFGDAKVRLTDAVIDIS